MRQSQKHKSGLEESEVVTKCHDLSEKIGQPRQGFKPYLEKKLK